jgi:hypothetical protein
MPNAAVIDIWVHATTAPVGYGGWCFVVRDGDRWTGAAGGATRTDAEAMVLSGLAAALEHAAGAPAGDLLIHLVDPRVLEAGETHPALRGAIAQALARWPGAPKAIGLRTHNKADALIKFLAAWADFARDKAKTRGAFSSPIPRLNIAKFVQDAI